MILLFVTLLSSVQFAYWIPDNWSVEPSEADQSVTTSPTAAPNNAASNTNTAVSNQQGPANLDKAEAYEWPTPDIHCAWLPWCDKWNTGTDKIEWVAANIVKLLIQYVAVFAVIALMCSWVLYMLSGWEEEKTKKAKNWIIWSMVAVVLSMSWYYIISIINNIEI